jgi:tetratricopeptide (TPR) repeat protein
LLGAFVALPAVMRPTQAPEPSVQRQVSPAAERRERRRSRGRVSKSSVDWQRFVALALVAWAIGGIIAVTWVKTINYPRAGLEASQAVDRFHRGDFQGSLTGLDRAIALAPDVPTYYSFKSSILAAYLEESDVPRHPECSQTADGTPYDICLGQRIFLSNLAAVQQRPYYWRSRLALANSALALGMNDEAIRLYREVVAMVPNSWPLINRLAEAYIDVGQPELALETLERSLAITGESNVSNEARRLQERANELLTNPQGSNSPAP